MAKKITGPQILTGNLLSDGSVVFLGSDGSWRNAIDTACLAHTPDDAAALESRGAKAVAENLLVEPYLIAVNQTAAGLVPVEFRERRRVAGPSVNLQFNSRINGELAAA